ncbi:MAG TPA: TonB-dependent receptor, partial [Thermoanaerobaculia bacterium]|nr:TonB-dependent receptor [Thermoanaerobaculia bacterium]
QSFGDPTGSGSTSQLGVFAQGEVNVTSKFLLRLGLRYDYERPIDPFPSDSNNVSPRVSFSWGPTESLRIKGGYGRFYGIAAIGPMFAVQIQDGVRVRTTIRVLGVGPAAASPTVPWNAFPDRRFPSEAAAGQGLYPPFLLKAGDYQSAHTDQYSFGLEYSLSNKLLVSLDGVNARGRNILIARNINPITIPPGGRPDPRYSDVYLYESTGNSWYSAGTLGLVSRLGGPVEFTAYYTYAKSEDDYIDWLTEFQPQDPLNPADERGPSVQSPDQKATVTGTFTTLHSGERRIGFTFSTIVDWRNGLHYNVLAGYDRNLNGDPLSDRPAGVRRNTGQLGSYFSLDLRASVSIPLGPDPMLELIAVCTNVTNNDNVLQRNNVQNLAPGVPNPAFGSPTLYGAGRILQLGAKFSF